MEEKRGGKERGLSKVEEKRERRERLSKVEEEREHRHMQSLKAAAGHQEHQAREDQDAHPRSQGTD